MSIFICEKQGHCCPHEFYDRIEHAISDSEDGVPCEHLVEVAPVVHGHWEWVTEDKYRCSACGVETRVDERFGEPMYKGCPYCFARMDGKDGETDGKKL